jgi:monovalent cation:H+ antiporter-2, CPA2 family
VGHARLVFGLGALELIVIGPARGFLSMMGQYWTGALALGLALASPRPRWCCRSPARNPGRAGGAVDAAVRGHHDRPDHLPARRAGPYAQADGHGRACSTRCGRGAVVVVVLLVIGRFVLPRLFAQAARTKSPEVFLAASLLVVIGASLATGLSGSRRSSAR